MAAGAPTKNALLKTASYLHCFWRSPIHCIPNQFHHYKWYSRFPHSISRKTKDLGIFVPTVMSSALSSIRSSPPGIGLIRCYLRMIETRPIPTKCLTSAFIYTVADLSSQTIVGETSEGYDCARTLRVAAYGLLIIGPSLHYWFNFASRMFPKRDIMSTIKKIVLGQTVYGPTVTAIFFSANAALQGENGFEIVARLKRDLIPTLISGIMYWSVCDFVTFKFIPVHLQPLGSNSFSYLWTVYLTYMASLEKVSTDEFSEEDEEMLCQRTV